MDNLFKKIRIYGLKRSFKFFIIDLYRKLYKEYIKHSFSQSGEDLTIDKILGYKKRGFYVDVGAYDPHRFSNTKRFYLRGWRGINIEPNTTNYIKFVKTRKKDVNLNIGIANINSKLLFYKFIPETLSTFSKEEAENYIKQGYQMNGKKIIHVKKLADVLNNYRPVKNIDFFSIDTEGFDLEVLKSNDWRRYRPRLICIESASHSMDKVDKKNPALDAFLSSKGYKLISDNGLNSIYKNNEG